MAQRCHLASFSNLQFPSYLGQQQQELGQQQQEQQQQQTESAVKTTTTEKKRITIKRKIVTTSQELQQGQQTMQEPQHPKQTIERKKITIKRKTVTTTTTTTMQSQEQPKNKQKCDDCFHTVTDYAPLETMFYQPRSDYIVPPPSCSRFFIENKHCFLRRHDNACIDPSTKKVIGFWNEQVGENCKLLPIETAYEEVLPSPPVVPTPSPKKQKRITKPRFVSDAQRSRVACEPVALLREKLALQYGIIKQRN